MTLIKDLPKYEKPRERLKKFGVFSLTDEELISIVLRCGTKNHSVKELSYQILKELNNIQNYQDFTINNLIKIKGIGEVKAITLLAAIELGRRTINNQDNKKITIYNADVVFNLFRYDFQNINQEHLIAVFLNSKRQVIKYKNIFIGTINKITTHPREIYKEAIKYCAVSLILVHNHPSGNPTPSKEDISFTNNIIEVGKILQIPMIDHIIIGTDKYFSFYDNGMVR